MSDNTFTPTDANPDGQVQFEQVLSPSEVESEAAIQIVTQDAERFKAWLEQYYFSTRWLIADALYQSPPNWKNWEGTTIPKAYVRKWTVATHVNAIKNKLLGGLFYEEPPFLLRPRPRANQDTIRAVEAVTAAQLDMTGFREEVKFGAHSALLYGTAIWKGDYYLETKTEWEFKRRAQPQTLNQKIGRQTRKVVLPTGESDEFEKVEVTRIIAYPRFRKKDIRCIFVDPATRVPDIRKAKVVIEEMWMTFPDLCKLADECWYDEHGVEHKRYDLPSEEEFRLWFAPPVTESESSSAETYEMNTNFVHHASPEGQATSVDPLAVPIRVLERWDCYKVMTVIEVNGKKRLIRNEPNPRGKIPYYSVNWWDIDDAFWGIGLGVCLSSEQMLQQGFTNAAADIVTLGVNGPILRNRGANANTQQQRARLGGFIDVDTEKTGGKLSETFAPFPVPKLPPEVFAIIQESEARTEQTSGANEMLTMGSMPAKGRTSLGRTATGAGAWQEAAESRLAGFIEDFNKQVFQPWLWEMHELNCQFLPMSALRQILNDELGDDFKVDEEDYLNGGRTAIQEFEVLAGSHLIAKQQIAQFMPFLLQYTMNPAMMQTLAEVNGVYADMEEVLHMAFDQSAAKNYYQIFKKLTPEMAARIANNSPAAVAQAKANAVSAQNDKKQQGKAELLDQKQKGELASKMVLQAQQRNDENLARANGEIDRQEIEQPGATEALSGGGVIGEGIGSVEA